MCMCVYVCILTFESVIYKNQDLQIHIHRLPSPVPKWRVCFLTINSSLIPAEEFAKLFFSQEPHSAFTCVFMYIFMFKKVSNNQFFKIG